MDINHNQYPSILLFQQDLRVEDNPALHAAVRHGKEIIPLFIWSPEEEEHWPLGGASKWWLHHSLLSLKSDLEKVGLTLFLRKGNFLTVIQQVIEETHADTVLWNRRYEPYAMERELRIKQALERKNIKAESFNAALLYEPWTVANKNGMPYQVFTSFWKTCLAMPAPEAPSGIPKSAKLYRHSFHSETVEDLKLLPKHSWDSGIRHFWSPGTNHAKKLLHQFLEQPILEYQQSRDFPNIKGISCLSPHLHFGEISSRMIRHEVLKRYQGDEDGVKCFLKQLVWREFAYHLLYHFPRTPEYPLRDNFNAFPWKNDQKALQAWQKGLTGYPIVDAGMRQLWKIGWMHNRVRMVVGSFLVKDLLISWVEGARWFWDTLVDADLANNTLGWQWVGGCGADAAPYFRIFNPITQGETFDPNGDYVREWVPELANLPNKWIHQPWNAPEMILRISGVTLGKTYPFPIVNHQIARDEALEAFDIVKKEKL